MCEIKPRTRTQAQQEPSAGAQLSLKPGTIESLVQTIHALKDKTECIILFLPGRPGLTYLHYLP